MSAPGGGLHKTASRILAERRRLGWSSTLAMAGLGAAAVLRSRNNEAWDGPAAVFSCSSPGKVVMPPGPVVFVAGPEEIALPTVQVYFLKQKPHSTLPSSSTMRINRENYCR